MSTRIWKCTNCHMAISYDASRGTPDRKFGGPCTRRADGNHTWHDTGR